MSHDLVMQRLDEFKIETPSWGYADTGSRFGKFYQDAAASTLAEKFADAGQVNKYTGCCPTVAVHVLWDFPPGFDAKAGCALAEKNGVTIGAINPNVFQDQCYKFGSLANRDGEIRRKAIEHHLYSIEIGKQTGSNLLSLWYADGSNYPGQADIVARKRWFQESLVEIYRAMPPSMSMLIEYKPFEPGFYHTDVADWGMAYILAQTLGDRAQVLVDTGHHYLAVNVEQIVAWLLDENQLGGFHFNDRKYADDDLTMGSINPYQFFRIFHEIENHRCGNSSAHPEIAYMVDQSHNIKPKIQAMIQTAMTAQEIYAKACMVDRKALSVSQRNEDTVKSENLLKDAYAADVRPLVAEWRLARGLPADPLKAFRESGYEQEVGKQRLAAHGSKSDGGYA